MGLQKLQKLSVFFKSEKLPVKYVNNMCQATPWIEEEQC